MVFPAHLNPGAGAFTVTHSFSFLSGMLIVLKVNEMLDYLAFARHFLNTGTVLVLFIPIFHLPQTCKSSQ